MDNINRVMRDNSSEFFFCPRNCQDEAIELLAYVMKDEEDLISYYCYELDFGRENYGMVIEDGKEYRIRNAKDVYELLTRSGSGPEDKKS